MGTPETRNVFGHTKGGVAVVIDQTPIPWCTAHHQRATKDYHGEWFCWFETTDSDCVISLGNPGHRWWADVE